MGLQTPTAVTWVQSLVGELRFCKPLSMTQKRKEKRKKFVWAKIAFRILGTRKVTLSLPGIGDRE